MNSLLEAIDAVGRKASRAGEVICILSMLHESVDRNSATRAFAGQTVLAGTLARLGLMDRALGAVILCRSPEASRSLLLQSLCFLTGRRLPPSFLPRLCSSRTAVPSSPRPSTAERDLPLSRFRTRRIQHLWSIAAPPTLVRSLTSVTLGFAD